MALINIENLTFSYDDSYDNIFENLSLQLDTDWKLGLIGRNGRGKTTLLNLLLGRFEYRGKISSPVEFDIFPFEIEQPELQALDALRSALPEFKLWRLLQEMALLELDEQVLYRPFCVLSNGERTKLMLAAMFIREGRFLLIDEPTNHLDMEGRRVLGRYLSEKKSFILASHDRALLDFCIDHILSLNRASVELQRGNFSSYQQNRDMRDRFELQRNQKLQEDISRLAKAAARTSKWSDRVEKTKYSTKNSGLRPDRGYIGAKSAKMMKRSKTAERRRQRAIDEKTTLLKDLEVAEDLAIHPLVYHSKRFVEFKNVGLKYGDLSVFEGLNLSLSQGQRLSILGKNGSGKSSILKIICGQDLPFDGNVYVASGLKISYVAQDTGFLSGSLDGFARKSGINLSLFLTILRKMNFERLQFEKDMADFSGGQKKKVLIAASLAAEAHLYVWDEPLNFIDLPSRMQIEELILNHRPTMLFVEHDRAFNDNIATGSITL
jgi:lincosamide and streptogramin A transport system ATP-binding/permease protein